MRSRPKRKVQPSAKFNVGGTASTVNKPPVLKIHKAAHLIDKNSRTIVKINQLLVNSRASIDKFK